ncbi:unnamed protein product [Peronospora farinosa]|uniref:Uncharacterized protein n=1 Tax=Peronospora farinosa TaxID=134698 RepID=A0AAV0STY9_9STRA|nr:unnamed protein product [Peronospora farinosa]
MNEVVGDSLASISIAPASNVQTNIVSRFRQRAVAPRHIEECNGSAIEGSMIRASTLEATTPSLINLDLVSIASVEDAAVAYNKSSRLPLTVPTSNKDGGTFAVFTLLFPVAA